jgi:hypothetical protein
MYLKLNKSKEKHMSHYDHKDAAISNMTLAQSTNVSPELLEFMQAMSKKNPTFKYGVEDNCRRSRKMNGDYSYKEVWVYRDTDAYAMGRIGFCTPNASNSHDSVEVYTVYSRAIRNDRFNDDRWGYYAVTTGNLDKAIKNASAYLRVYKPAECAEATKTKFADHYKQAIYQATAAQNDVNRQIRWSHNEAITNELIRAVKDGYMVMNSGVSEVLAKLILANNEAEKQAARKLQAYHVRVYEERGVQMASVLNVIEIEGSKDGVAGEHTSMRVNDLPEDIAGKIAVLSMVDSAHYVDGVGLRAPDGTYWVARDEAP